MSKTMKREDAIVAGVLGQNRFQPDCDWQYLLERSKEEGVAQLLYFYANESSDKTKVPPNILDELKNIYYNASLSNMQLESELGVVVKNLDAQGIPSVVLKGIFLAEAVYKNISLRPAADIDLLIKKDDLARVDAALCSLGYDHPPCYDDFLRKKTVTAINSLVYNKRDGGFYIHLHWHLINSSWPLEEYVERLDMERVWSQAETFELNGRSLRALSPEHLLIYVLYHGLQHYYDRLILVADVIQTLKVYEARLEPGEVIEEAKRLGVDSVVLSSLRCCRWRLGQADIFLDRWSRALGQSQPCWAIRKLPWSRALFYLISYKALCLENRGLFRQISSLWRTLFPSRYVMAHALSLPVARVRFFHYLQRLKNNISIEVSVFLCFNNIL